jgi:hypothetical protein
MCAIAENEKVQLSPSENYNRRIFTPNLTFLPMSRVILTSNGGCVPNQHPSFRQVKSRCQPKHCVIESWYWSTDDIKSVEFVQNKTQFLVLLFI